MMCADRSGANGGKKMCSASVQLAPVVAGSQLRSLYVLRRKRGVELASCET